MPDEIIKLRFKQDAEHQIEVVSLHSLIKSNKEHLVIPHRTNFYHIFIFDNCNPTHLVDFEPVKIKPFSLLFINKDQVHQFDRLLGYAGNVIIFTDDFYCTSENDIRFLRSSILFNNLANNQSIELPPSSYQKFINICENITEELRLPADNSKLTILKNLLHNFLLLADREKQKQGFKELKKAPDLDYTLLFRDLLEANYKIHQSVTDYTRGMGVSEKRLRQATMKVLGKSPKEIIKDRVLLEAKRLLVHTYLSIKEIGLQLGFEDPAYFVRYFKFNTKTTPVEFRESHLNN